MNDRKAGRPRTDRKKITINLNEQEERAVRVFADIARRKGADYALDLLKRVAALKASQDIEDQLRAE